MDNTEASAASGPEDTTTPLEQAEARADHYERIVAALVKRFGPLRLYPGEYHAADPASLVLLGTSEEDQQAGRIPTFALREQITADGRFITQVASTAAVIEAFRNDPDGAIAAARHLLALLNMVTDQDQPVTEPLPPVGGSDG